MASHPFSFCIKSGHLHPYGGSPGPMPPTSSLRPHPAYKKRKNPPSASLSFDSHVPPTLLFLDATIRPRPFLASRAAPSAAGLFAAPLLPALCLAPREPPHFTPSRLAPAHLESLHCYLTASLPPACARQGARLPPWPLHTSYRAGCAAPHAGTQPARAGCQGL
jgi:hypothetical protein